MRSILAKTTVRTPLTGREVRSLLLCYHRYESHPTVVMESAIIRSLQDFDEDDEIPVISGRGEGIMEEAPATGSGAARRNEDIALDLMKFVAMTTGFGRTTSTGVGFSGSRISGQARRLRR